LHPPLGSVEFEYVLGAKNEEIFMAIKEPIILIRNGVKWYAYDFTYRGKRYRGWMGAVSVISKRKAMSEFRKTYAKIVTTEESPVRQRLSSLPSEIFKEYKKYLETHRAGTYKSYKYLCYHFENFFRGKVKITDRDIADYQNKKLEEGLAPATVNRHLTYCRAAFNRAKVSPNPFANHTRYDELERTRYLTEDELGRLLTQCNKSPNSQLPLIVLTAILTGFRKMEILGLHQRHIDFGNQLISVPVKGGGFNTVPLPDELVLPFKRNLKKHESGYVFENQFTKTAFTDVKRGWHKVLKDAKIDDFVFHDLRHTFATYVLLASRDLRMVQSLLGHKSISQTQKYTHVLTQEKLNAIRKLGQFVTGINNKSENTK